MAAACKRSVLLPLVACPPSRLWNHHRPRQRHGTTGAAAGLPFRHSAWHSCPRPSAVVVSGLPARRHFQCDSCADHRRGNGHRSHHRSPSWAAFKQACRWVWVLQGGVVCALVAADRKAGRGAISLAPCNAALLEMRVGRLELTGHWRGRHLAGGGHITGTAARQLPRRSDRW